MTTPTRSLSKRVLLSAGWVTAGFALSQLIRLASNLLLTRSLAPESFGLMAIIIAYHVGLSLFSDLGIGPNIIQNRRGQDEDFLNAAWTMQVIRGIGIWLVCAATSWPMAIFYGEPQLLWLIPAAGFVSVLTGLNSTSVFTQERSLQVGRMTLAELGSQIAALCVMVALASRWPSVWILIAGSWLSALLRLWATHAWLPGIRHRWNWSPEIFLALIHFGKWIFLSTLLGFASSSSASLVMGKFVSMKEVGLFAIATTLAKAIEQIYYQLSNKVLYPLFNQIKTLPHDILVGRLRQIKLVIFAAFLPTLLGTIIWAETITDILFDHRYQGIAWILRLFALGMIPTIISGLGPFYLAVGDARTMSLMSGVRLMAYLVGMVVGWKVYGLVGLVTGMSCFTFAVYVVEAFVQRKFRVWLPGIDSLAFLFCGCVLLIVYNRWGLH